MVVVFGCLLMTPLQAESPQVESLQAAPMQAALEAYQFDSTQMETDYNRLIKELRCLVCQNQNLAGSDADLARDLRQQTYEMLRDGSSPDQVIEFMVARYGDFVLYRPQFKANTYLLWLGPIVLLGVILFLLLRRLARENQDDANQGGGHQVDATPESVAAARELLEQPDTSSQ